MLTISPPAPPLFGYPLEDPRSHGGDEVQNTVYHNNSYNNGETETSESLLNSPTFGGGKVAVAGGGVINDDEEVPKMAKKINHNASERDRRKRINSLYSSLRSLLPPAYQEKKLSIPATVSRVLKYIPELHKEMEALTKKKESLLRRISEQETNSTTPTTKKQKRSSTQSSPSSKPPPPPPSLVSAAQISDREVTVQISTMKSIASPLYAEVLLRLEQNGLVLLNSSCFESSSHGTVFYNLHLQVCEARVIDLEELKKQLRSLYENQDEPLLSNLKSIGQIAEIFVKK